jgi:hypothetical protein
VLGVNMAMAGYCRTQQAQGPDDGTIRVCDEYISDSSSRGGMSNYHHSRAQGQLCKGSEDCCSPMKQTSTHMPDKSDTSPGPALVIPTHSYTFQHAWNIPTGLLIHRGQHVACQGSVAPCISRCLPSLTFVFSKTPSVKGMCWGQ